MAVKLNCAAASWFMQASVFAPRRRVQAEAGGAGNGAAEGTRTPDPIITNDVLYQLSYSGTGSSQRLETGAARLNTAPVPRK